MKAVRMTLIFIFVLLLFISKSVLATEKRISGNTCDLQVNGIGLSCFTEHLNDCSTTKSNFREFEKHFSPKSLTQEYSNGLILTWTQIIPNKAKLIGYFIQLQTQSNPNDQSCFYLQFTDTNKLMPSENAVTVTYKPSQNFSTLVSLHPVFHKLETRKQNPIRSRRILQVKQNNEQRQNNIIQAMKNISIQVLRNNKKDLIQINVDKHDFILNDNYLTAFMATLCYDGSDSCEFINDGNGLPQPIYLDMLAEPINIKYKYDQYTDDSPVYIKLCPVFNYIRFYPDENDQVPKSAAFKLTDNDPIDENNKYLLDERSLTVEMELTAKPDLAKMSCSIEVKIKSNSPHVFEIEDCDVTLSKLNDTNEPEFKDLIEFQDKTSLKKGSHFKIDFPDLELGNYEVIVTPKSFTCDTNKMCNSQRIQFQLNDKEYDPNIFQNRASSNYIVIPLVCGFMIFLGILTIIFYKKNKVKKIKFNRLLQRNSSLLPTTSLAEIYDRLRQQPRKEVLIFYHMVGETARTIVEASIPVMEKVLHVKLIKSCVFLQQMSPDILSKRIESIMKSEKIKRIFVVAPDYDVDEYLNNFARNTENVAESIYFFSLRMLSSNDTVAAKSVILKYDGLNHRNILQTRITREKWIIPENFGQLFFTLHDEWFTYNEFLNYWQNDNDFENFRSILD